MTYQVLLVDDEPIILSGIKFLIDWEKNHCNIIGTARNGQQALEAIRAFRPHIVVCDINMPVMSGMELLKTVSDQSCMPVFIMLTNYGEFDLARKSLRYRAVDYLLKSHLEAESLENSLALAKQECERRGGLARVDMADTYIRDNRSQMIAQKMQKLLSAPLVFPSSVLEQMSDELFQSYCFLHLIMDFSSLPSSEGLSEEETSKLYDWEAEVIDKLAGNLFTDYTALTPDSRKQSLTLFCWNVTGNIHDLGEQFYAKLCAASGNITQVHLSLLAGDLFHGKDSVAAALSQYHLLCEYYYNTPCSCCYADSMQEPLYQPLSFGEITNKLILALRSRNADHCHELLMQASQIIATIPHRKSDAVKECTVLYTSSASILQPMLPEHQNQNYFTENAATLHKIACLTSRSAVIKWLAEFEVQLLRILEQLGASKSDLAEKARSYVIENVDKRIMLQDVANYINLSPGYLSALFKKEYRQNFVDFINETKMERACVLMRENKYRMYEISYMLGFDNAYYFTKVFKKHTGMTPTEYQRKMNTAK